MGHVFKSKDKYYLIRCPKCEMENYGPAVSSGQCCWCGHAAQEEDVDMEE